MSELVACNSCGNVMTMLGAADFVRCPICENTTRKTTAVPRCGRVHMWWEEV